MSSRPRSPRADRLPRKRTLRPRLEDLELRLVLSTQEFSASPLAVVFTPTGQQVPVSDVNGFDAVAAPPASALSPSEMRSYYGLNNVMFGSIKGDGTGQTIAIVDAYDDPGFVNSTSPNFANSDLARFDQYFGLANPPSFTKMSQTGSTTSLPAADPGWAVEESLDVEWAHSIAPGASIVLVEAAAADNFDLGAAEQYAASLPGVSVVSNSWGGAEGPADQNALAPAFVQPANHQGVTFMVATGDDGSSGTGGDDYDEGMPDSLPGVVAVGGTSLLMENGSPTQETSWNTGAGGIDPFEPEPTYQDNVQSSGFRETPDVSMDAALVFGGVAVYNSYVEGPTDPWLQVGGTSLACPMFTAVVAIADQGRVLAGGTTLDGLTQTLPALYSVPYDDFNDIVSGDNEGHPATPGYDMNTGLGSPRANLLIPDLATYGLATQPQVQGQPTPNIRVAFNVQPPSTVDPGESFGLAAAVQAEFGSSTSYNTDYQFNGTATLYEVIGGTSTLVTQGPVVDGVADFDGLTLATGGSAQYQVVMGINGKTFPSSLSVTVTASATSGTQTLTPAPDDASLTNALKMAASDSSSNITIKLESGIYPLNLGGSAGAPLVIDNTSTTVPLKTITIIGAGEGSTIIVPTQPQGWTSSIFEIIGKAGDEVAVKIEGLTIEGGEAASGGVLGGKAGLGGGILIDGGDVTLDSVALLHDMAVGQVGTAGTKALRKLQGSVGGNGQIARGGGLYVAAGSVKLTGVTFTDDNAWGGQGGTGGQGGSDGGRGGTGGRGGSATGGGAYVAGGTVTGSNDAFSNDAAIGGWGGYGGYGGLGGTELGLGAGGRGGQAGNAYGGGLYVGGGSVTFRATPMNSDVALGGRAGTGGEGGHSHLTVYSTFFGFSTTSYPFFVGRGGSAGTPGDAAGGGVYVGGGSLTLGTPDGAVSDIMSDRAQGGYFGSTGDARIAGVFFSRADQTAGPAGSLPPISPGPIRPPHYVAPTGQVPHAPGQHPIRRPARVGDTGAHHDFSSSSSSGFSTSGPVGYASGGGIYIAGGSVTLFAENVSGDLANFGGGIEVSNGASLSASNLTMKSDAAEVGGALLNSGSVNIAFGVLSHNKAALLVDNYSVSGSTWVGAKGSTGGAIANYGQLGFTSANISNNSARYGGGIFSRSGNVVASALSIDNNLALTRGGGIYSIQGSLTLFGDGTATIDGNNVSATGSSLSVAVGSGGGIDIKSGSASITGMSISGNSARAGGGIYVASGSATIDDTDLEDNLARQDGGAVYNGGTVSISGGMILGNYGEIDGGAIDNFASLKINNATLTANTAGANGGAINSPAAATLGGVTISGNTAGGLGGGIDNGGTLIATSTMLTLNRAASGAGLFDVGTAKLTASDVITQNTAVTNGGGLDEGSGGQVKGSGLAISSNVAQQGNGGGIYDKRGSLSIIGGEISGNNAPAGRGGATVGWGGGLFDSGGKVSLSSSPVRDNSAVDGAGMYISSGSVSLANEEVNNNTAAAAGGGVDNLGTLSLTTATITANTATTGGGGGVENTGKLTIANSTFSLNAARSGTGGDLDNGAAATATISQSTLTTGVANSGGDAANAGSLTISTTTLSFGSATTTGGGIADINAGILKLSNATVADNTSIAQGGGIDTQGTLTAVNVTIAYNHAGLAGAGLAVDSGTASVVNTIIDLDDVGSSLATAATEVAGTLKAQAGSDNLIGTANPDLGPLASNGGLTQTIALMPGSPAIDAGNNALAVDPTSGQALTTDQRGALRGGKGGGLNAGSTVDVGAYEASSSYMVTSTADSLTIAGTLRSALDWAAGSSNYNPANMTGANKDAPNTVVFQVSGTFAIPQTITLTSALPSLVTKVDPNLSGPIPIEIEGPGGDVVTVSGGGKLQVFAVAPSSQVILQGITVAGGSASLGGGVDNAGILTLNNTILMGNTATSSGGAVFSSGRGSSLSINGGTIEDNSATSGGGVYSLTNLTLSDVTIQGNSATDGGGVYGPSGGTLTMTGSNLTENTAAAGAGLYLTNVTANITGGALAGNTATEGGGLYASAGGSVTITGTSFTGNAAVGVGGAISSAGPITIAAASFADNSAGTGGAIGGAGSLTIAASTLTANTATGDGGAINTSGSLAIQSSTLSGNSAGGAGGGIVSTSSLSVVGSTFSSNRAAQGAGLDYDANSGTGTITNATFATNTAATAGGGIVSFAGTLTLVNTTIAYNTLSAANGSGSGLDIAGGTAALYNTIVDSDTGTGTTDVAGGSLAAVSSNNVIGLPSPGLGTLASNGGPTKTIALLAGSPAIDAGNNTISGVNVPTTDQRGAVRGGTGALYANAGEYVDIGAYEASSEYEVNTGADSLDLNTLRTGVGWANVSTNANPANLSHPAPNTVDFSATEGVSLTSALGTLILSNTTTSEAIIGSTTGSTTVSGGNAVGVFQVDAGVAATMTDLQVTGGSAAAGGGINNIGTLTFSGGTVSSNAATGSGGGINNTGTLTLSNAGVESNTATGSGGGINNTGKLTLTGSVVISGNTAAVAGGGVADSGTLTLDGASINGNSAVTGGGIAVGGTLTDTGSILQGNAATTGGGLAVTKGGSATLTGTVLYGNTAGSASAAGSGGGIDNAGTLNLIDATIGQTSGQGNTATGKGGGIANESGGTLNAASTYSTIANNKAGTQGGGLYNAGTAMVSVITLSSNSAGTTGGGVGNDVGGTLTLSDATMLGNAATTGGGGFANAGTATLANATLATNQGGKGGGVYDTGVVTINSTTIAFNSAIAGGTAGGLDAVSGTTILYNTIVAENQSGVGTASDAVGSLAPISSFDMFGTGGSGGLTAIDGNIVNVKTSSLDLAAPANNGGPTETIALLAGSPAIDAGSASIPNDTVPTLDERGALRGPTGLDAGSAPDIGAFEDSSSYLVSTTTDSNQIGTLRAAMSWANVSVNANPEALAATTPTPNTAVFDTSNAFATAATITLALGPITLSNASTAGESIDGTASNGLSISGGGSSQLFSIASGTNVVLTGLTISDGSSSTSGGAIINQGTLTVSDSTLSGNSAAMGGGAIDNQGTLTIKSSTLSGNSAGEYGGAIDDESDGTLILNNSTFADNAAAQGGGIYSKGTLTSVNATIAYNTSTGPNSGGGLMVAADGVATLFNTIVASNTDTSDGNPADDIGGFVVLGSSDNMIGDGGSGGLQNGSNGNIVLTSTQSPGLATGLGNNGGPTQTIALTSTSPAIGTGVATIDQQTIVNDQRGAARGTTTIDIGAYEYSSSYLVTSPLDSTIPGTLRSAIAWANADTAATAPLEITFDIQNAFATPQSINLALGTLDVTNTSQPVVIVGVSNPSMITINGGGNAGVFSVDPGVTFEVYGITISGGLAGAGGGINNAGTLVVNDVVFAGNATTPNGSGAAINNAGTAAVLNVTNSSFQDNTGSYYGGAIYNDDGTATVSDTDFTGNSTLYGLGGAIDNFGGTLTVTGGTFVGNSAFQGGAIYNRDDAANNLAGVATLNGVTIGTAPVTGSTITGNSAYQGGGLFNEGTMTVTDSTIAENTAFQGGGASNNYGGTMTLSDDTLAFNSAQQFGGAIDSVSTLTVIASTVAYNVVATGGSSGGIDAYGGTAALYDTIAALNTVGSGAGAVASDLGGQYSSSSAYNMIVAGTLTNGVNGNIVLATTANPGLAPSLANNGGPTETIALYTGSPAIGAGSATIAGVAVPSLDQRGVARPSNGFDIGAYQGSIPAPVTTTSPTKTPTSTPILAVAAPSDPPAAATANVAPIISAATPFHGRHLSAKAHKKTAVKHPSSGSHQSTRAAAAHAKRVVTVRIKHKKD